MSLRPCRLIALVLLPMLLAAQSAMPAYNQGQSFLNSHRWEDALNAFNRPSPNGVAPEGLSYWKAFALAQLGRKQEASSALAQIPDGNPWRKEAAVLEAALRGDFKPEPEDAEILRGLNTVNADSARTLAAVQQILGEPHTPQIKMSALATLQLLNSEAGRDLLRQVAQGSVNPDLQRNSLSTLGRIDPQALVELYPGIASDESRQMVYSILASTRDKQRIVQLARGEKVERVRSNAYTVLVMQMGAYTEALGLLATEPSERLRKSVSAMIDSFRNSTATALSDLRSPDPKLRQRAASTLARSSDASAASALEGAYRTDTDPDVRNAIVFALVQLREFDKVYALAVAEKDVTAKRTILQRLIMDDEGIKSIR